MSRFEHLSLAELEAEEQAIADAKQDARRREVARIEAEAIEAGYSLEDLIGKKQTRRAREGKP